MAAGLRSCDRGYYAGHRMCGRWVEGIYQDSDEESGLGFVLPLFLPSKQIADSFIDDYWIFGATVGLLLSINSFLKGGLIRLWFAVALHRTSSDVHYVYVYRTMMC